MRGDLDGANRGNALSPTGKFLRVGFIAVVDDTRTADTFLKSLPGQGPVAGRAEGARRQNLDERAFARLRSQTAGRLKRGKIVGFAVGDDLKALL
jgi:hypothetical protein